MDPLLEEQLKQQRFSISIENILKECHEMQSPSYTSMSKYIETQISRINLEYEQLKSSDLNPVKYEASRAYHNGKKRLNAYLKEKSKLKDTMNHDRLRRLLHEEPLKVQPNQLSFSNLNESEISFLLSNNKRKFGLQYKNFSADASPQHSVLPSINHSPVNSPMAVRQESKLNRFINSMIDKQLGILPKPIAMKRRQRINRDKQKQEVVRRLGPIALNTDHEEEYLTPEFKMYNENVKNKLKVQRLVVEKHARDRRATLKQLPFIKANINS